MTTADGLSVTEITADGLQVTEATADGLVAWTSASDLPGPDEGDINLTPYVPQWAMDLWNNRPDDYRAAFPTTDKTSYAGQNGDLATAVEDASSNGDAAWLGTGNTYRIDSTINAPGNMWGLIGENCTIYYDRRDLTWILNPLCQTGVIKGVEFVFENDGDAGVLGGEFSNELWAEDVIVSGERDKDPSTTIFTWRPYMTDASAEGFCHNIQLKDGSFYDGGSAPPGGSGCYGIATDPPHDGKIAYIECLVQYFTGNGYYMSYEPNSTETGEALLWECQSINNHRGNFRLGENDMAIGGLVQVNNMEGSLEGQGIVFDNSTGDQSKPTQAIGVTVTGNDFSAEAIVARNHDFAGSDAWVRMENNILDTNTPNRPIRFSEADGVTLHVELKNEYHYYDAVDPVNNLMNIWSGDVTVPDGDLHILSEESDEFFVDTGGRIFIEGTEYGPGNYTRTQLGLDSPLDSNGELPTTYFA